MTAFAEWVVAMHAGMRTGDGIDVPCGECVACCTSAQQIVVDDDERGALPAHAAVDGVLATDANGACVLLVDGRCTVYERRPRRCRTYDCRIFEATGVAPEADKPAIAARAAQWSFTYDTDDDRRRRDAVRMAAVVIRSSQDNRPSSATQLAATAIQLHEELL